MIPVIIIIIIIIVYIIVYVINICLRNHDLLTYGIGPFKKDIFINLMIRH
jgi:hypothetical protein